MNKIIGINTVNDFMTDTESDWIPLPVDCDGCQGYDRVVSE